MKTEAKQIFSRCRWVFVAAAAVLLVLGGGYGGITYSNNLNNINTINTLNTQNSGLSTQQVEDLNQLVDEFKPAATAAAAVLSLIVSLVALVLILCVGILEVGFSHMALIASAGGTPKFGDFFTPFKRFGRWLGFILMMGLRVLLWSLLFIIPGIIAAFRYSQAAYLMLENPNLGINESLKRSGELMRGYKARLFVLGLSFIPWWLLSAVTFGLAELYVTPYVELTHVQFYYDLRRERPLEGLAPSMAFAVAAPVAPVAPTVPVVPVAAPVAPTVPVAPVAPTAPIAPEAPLPVAAPVQEVTATPAAPVPPAPPQQQ